MHTRSFYEQRNLTFACRQKGTKGRSPGLDAGGVALACVCGVLCGFFLFGFQTKASRRRQLASMSRAFFCISGKYATRRGRIIRPIGRAATTTGYFYYPYADRSSTACPRLNQAAGPLLRDWFTLPAVLNYQHLGWRVCIGSRLWHAGTRSYQFLVETRPTP